MTQVPCDHGVPLEHRTNKFTERSLEYSSLTRSLLHYSIRHPPLLKHCLTTFAHQPYLDTKVATMAQIQEEPIIAALHDYIQQERMRNFHFLDRHSHLYKQQEDLLVVTRADPNDLQALRSRRGTEVASDWNGIFTILEPLRAYGFKRIVSIEIQPGDAVTVENMVILELGHKGQKTTRNPGMKAADWLQMMYCNDADDTWAMQFSE